MVALTTLHATVAAANSIHTIMTSLKDVFSRNHPKREGDLTWRYQENALDILDEARSIMLNRPDCFPPLSVDEYKSEFARILSAVTACASSKDAEEVLRAASAFRTSVKCMVPLAPSGEEGFALLEEGPAPDEESALAHTEVKKAEEENLSASIIMLRESSFHLLLSKPNPERLSTKDAPHSHVNLQGLRIGPMPKHWFDLPESIQFKFHTLLDSILPHEIRSVDAHVFAYDAKARHIYVEFSHPIDCATFEENWAAMPPIDFEGVSVHPLV